MASVSCSEVDAKKRFSEIHQRLRNLGVADHQITKLASFKELQRVSQAKPFAWLFAIITAAFCILTAALVFVLVFTLLFVGNVLPKDPRIEQLHKSISEIWMDKVLDADIDSEPCLLDMPELLQDPFRPPVNCSICRNVGEIQKVSDLSREEFEGVYAYTARPIVVTDGMGTWTAQQVFSFDFFKTVYGKQSPVLEGSLPDCQFFPYKTKFSSLKEVFDMAPERANLSDGSSPWYIGWSNCDSSAANILRQHYNRPYFLPAESESSKTDWIFMGSPGYGAQIHIDDVDLPSWQAQVKGHKKWTLEPPPECYLECQTVQVDVHPGEIIVLDTNKWFHETLIIGDEMSITIGSEYD